MRAKVGYDPTVKRWAVTLWVVDLRGTTYNFGRRVFLTWDAALKWAVWRTHA